MNTTIPGIKAVHAIITPTCRMNRTDAGAFDEAVRRLRDEYIACLRGAVTGNFHLVLTVERREGETPAPLSEPRQEYESNESNQCGAAQNPGDNLAPPRRRKSKEDYLLDATVSSANVSGSVRTI